jgi:hypothetical protein
LAASKHTAFVFACLGVALGLGGCMLLDEPRRYHLEKEWSQLRNLEVAEFTERTVGLHPTNTIPLKYRTQACRDLPLERRTTIQDGVTDHAVYTQCWRAPYYNSGQRMQNRPEPQS